MKIRTPFKSSLNFWHCIHKYSIHGITKGEYLFTKIKSALCTKLYIITKK